LKLCTTAATTLSGEEEIGPTDRHTLAEWLKEDEENAFSGTRGLSLKLLFICTQDPELGGCQSE